MPFTEINPIAVPGPGRTPGDGQLHLTFVYLGKGACTYIICPNGKRVLIDAGSVDFDGLSVLDMIKDLDYVNFDPNNPAKTYLQVDVLILTHGDVDHYNQILALVGASPLQEFYYGGNLATDYTNGNFRHWRNNGVANLIHPPRRLVVNAGDPAPKILVDGGNNCVIYAVAGCVDPTTNQDDGWRKNTNSIVTKIAMGADSCLVCGDATTDTEDFMLNGRNDAGSLSVRTLLTPHHGSLTSSSQAFVNATNPNMVVINYKYGNGHGLPKREVINRWLNAPTMRAQEAVPLHNIGTYYQGYNRANISPIQTDREIYQTGSDKQSIPITMDGQ